MQKFMGVSVLMWVAPTCVLYTETGAEITDFIGRICGIENRYTSKALGAVLAVIFMQIVFVIMALVEKHDARMKHVPAPKKTEGKKDQ